mgnify:CR=1 FL=1
MPKIFKLSEATSLGLHSMIIIARNEGLVNAKKIAEITSSSPNHLAKILQQLVKEGFIKAQRGPSGGYVLRKKPKEIRLIDIYQCIDGPIETEGCPVDKEICPFGKCILGDIIPRLSREFKKYLKKNTLQDYL